MMKTSRKKTSRVLTRIVCAAAACALLAACHRNGLARQVVPVIVPRVPGEATPAAVSPAPDGPQVASSQPQPRITIDPRDTVLQVITTNLKPGPGEEQVLAVKRLSEVDSPVRLIVVDLDPERGTYYFQSWESPTNATDNRVFSLAVKDLVGDGDVQLVASGMNRDGKLTLDVFHRTPAPLGNELVYKPVCQIVADDIRVQDAGQADSSGDQKGDQKNGPNTLIETYLRDPDSSNVTDLVNIMYRWNAAEGRYVPGAAEKVPGGQVGQEQLSKLFTNMTASAFEDFLAGSWADVEPDPLHAGRLRYPSIISIDPRSRKISVSSGDTQEIYQWRDTLRQLYNRVYLIGENDTVPQISRTFAVTALSSVSLSIQMQGNDSAELPAVTYVKIGEDVQQSLLGGASSAQATPGPSLSGIYRGANGLSVDFRNPNLTWRNGNTRRTAVYVLFPLRGRSILSIRFVGQDGSSGDDKSWLVDYTEKKDPASIVRTLLLSPVQLTVKGFEDAAGDALSLEQSLDLRPK